MEWQDQGLLLSVRPHGEHAAIIDALTAGHGRHVGVVRGGMSRRLAPLLQPGNDLALQWRARLEDHIGSFTVEPLLSRTGLMADRLALAGLNAVCALLHVALAEREPHPDLLETSRTLLERMRAGGDWTVDYVQWELGLLAVLGFGLDLSRCAASGRIDDLAYVSPKTGRAVSRKAAGPWADRLFPLPALMGGPVGGNGDPVQQSLTITGHFLERELADLRMGKSLPPARDRLIAMLGS